MNYYSVLFYYCLCVDCIFMHRGTPCTGCIIFCVTYTFLIREIDKIIILITNFVTWSRKELKLELSKMVLGFYAG